MVNDRFILIFCYILIIKLYNEMKIILTFDIPLDKKIKYIIIFEKCMRKIRYLIILVLIL